MPIEALGAKERNHAHRCKVPLDQADLVLLDGLARVGLKEERSHREEVLCHA